MCQCVLRNEKNSACNLKKNCFLFPPTENITSLNTAFSLATTFSSPLVSAATTVPTPALTPSSVYSLPRTSTYNVGKRTSLQSKATAKTPGFSTNKLGSTALTSSVSSHGVPRTKIPHLSALMTTRTFIINNAPVLTTTRATVSVSVATESPLVSRNTVQVLPSRLTTSSELKELERTETTRMTISLIFQYTLKSVHQTSLFSQMSRSNPRVEISKMTNTSTRLHRTLGLINLTSLSQHTSSPPSVPSPQISASKDQQTETARKAFSSLRHHTTFGRHNQTSLPQFSSPLGILSSQPIVSTLFSTSTIGLPCTTHEEIIKKRTETKDKMTTSTIHQRQTFLSVSSLQTMASSLMSTPSVSLRCVTNEEVTALPTAQPEEASAIPGIILQFQPVKGDQELVRTN